MANFLLVAQQVGILFALMAVGFACSKTRLLADEHATDGLVKILIHVVTPCLIVDVFPRAYDPSMLRGLAISLLLACLAHAALIGAVYPLVRHRAEGTRRVLRLAAVFSNAGFMGIPLEQAVLGEQGVFYGVSYIVAFNLFMWSWGVREMGGRANVRMMLVNPGTIGLALGLPIFFLSLHLPAVVSVPIHHIAALNTPLAMIIIGFYLAHANWSVILRRPQIYWAGSIRLVLYPLAFIAALAPFRHHLDRTLVLALVTAASAPVAAMVSMFAAHYRQDVDASVGLVSGTTLLSIFTMPVILALAMEVF